jgi:Zn-dependent alcohol dehydrogenase
VNHDRVVESVGEHVDDFAAGDAVVPTFLSQCSECADCRSSRSNVCSKYRFAVRPGMPRDDTTRFRDADGSPLHHFLGVSSFSEYTVVDVTQVVKVDPALPPPTACLLSCGASTGQYCNLHVLELPVGVLIRVAQNVWQGSERHGSWLKSSLDLQLLSSDSALWDWR